MNRGQVTVETMIGIIILLFFFIVSLGVLAQVNWGQHILETQAVEWNECIRIAGLIQEVFIQGPGTQIRVWSAYGLDVSSTFVYVGSVSCGFTAKVEPVSLTAGAVVISNPWGSVELSNVGGS